MDRYTLEPHHELEESWGQQNSAGIFSTTQYLFAVKQSKQMVIRSIIVIRGEQQPISGFSGFRSHCIEAMHIGRQHQRLQGAILHYQVFIKVMIRLQLEVNMKQRSHLRLLCPACYRRGRRVSANEERQLIPSTRTVETGYIQTTVTTLDLRLRHRQQPISNTCQLSTIGIPVFNQTYQPGTGRHPLVLDNSMWFSSLVSRFSRQRPTIATSLASPSLILSEAPVYSSWYITERIMAVEKITETRGGVNTDSGVSQLTMIIHVCTCSVLQY